MAGIDRILRSAVKLAAREFRSVEMVVTHRAWVRQTGPGDPIFEDTDRRALVEKQLQRKALPDGQLVAVQAVVTFLDQVESNGAPKRQEPIDPRDIIVFADGSFGPIAYVDGTTDPSRSETSYFTIEVWVGVRWTRG